jgi:hypothetical protein
MPQRRNRNFEIRPNERSRRGRAAFLRQIRKWRGTPKSINDLDSQGNRIANEIKAAYDKAKSEGNKARMKQLHKRLIGVYKSWDRYAMNTRGYLKNRMRDTTGLSSFPLTKEDRTDNNNAAKWLGKGFARELRNEGIRAAKQDAANLLGAKVLNEG